MTGPKAARYLPKRAKIEVCPVCWRICAIAQYDRRPNRCKNQDHRTLYDPVELDAQLADRLEEAAKRYHGVPIKDIKGRAAALDEWIAAATGQKTRRTPPEQEGLF